MPARSRPAFRRNPWGARNSTGLPWAPILASPSPRTRAPLRLELVARCADVIYFVADVVNAAVGIALEKFRNRRRLP